jgi:hypothetical protein
VDTNGRREEETEARTYGVGQGQVGKEGTVWPSEEKEGIVWSSEDERMLFEWGWSKGVDRSSPIRPAMCPSSGCRGLVRRAHPRFLPRSLAHNHPLRQHSHHSCSSWAQSTAQPIQEIGGAGEDLVTDAAHSAGGDETHRKRGGGSECSS